MSGESETHRLLELILTELKQLRLDHDPDTNRVDADLSDIRQDIECVRVEIEELGKLLLGVGNNDLSDVCSALYSVEEKIA